ncbi:MAG: Dps family protein, partial [Deltaproteobacteria bacterium]
LHTMFEEHYTELAMAVDVVAERIRALGLPAPGSYGAFGRLSTVPDTDGVPKALEMVKLLVEAHETVIRTARQVVHVAEAAGDQATADLGTQRLQLHEKTAWMLRSLLED